MLRIDIITCAPSLIDKFFSYGVINKAQKNGIAKIVIHNLRDYAIGSQQKIDDAPYGGEAGMVLRIEPFVKCIEKLQKDFTYDVIILLTAEGKILNQKICNKLSTNKNILILCGHYKGIDERIVKYFNLQKISIGNFILPGGELPAALLVQSVVRLVPGAISDGTAALNDSFQEDGIISHAVYTRPASFRGLEVPEVLLSGHKEHIDNWRNESSDLRTKEYESNNKK